MLSLFCVLKGLKLGLVRSKPRLEASSQAAQAGGELGLLIHLPCCRYSSAWQKRGLETEVQRALATSALLQPPPLTCASPSLAGPLCSSPRGHPCCSRARLFLCCRAGAVAVLNEGCAFKHEDFQSVNYREHLQLPFKSQHCLCAPSSTDRLGCHPGWERGTHWWILSPAGAPGSPTPLLGSSQGSPGVSNTLNTWPWTGLGFELCFPPSVMSP